MLNYMNMYVIMCHTCEGSILGCNYFRAYNINITAC